MIPFNIPYITGKETEYINDAVAELKLSGNGKYTKLCHRFLEERYQVHKTLLTTSCTDALEMAAMLIEIKPGDEVIVPSYTFVSSALAFTRMGAKIVFVDSLPNHPNMDTSKLAQAITSKTKAIVPVHYGGVACNMDEIMRLANEHNLYVIEDAAQAIESKFKNQQLGTIGHFGVLSFHETKNIQCGEGGALFINDPKFAHRAEILWEKGTNRASFFRGEINKYGWVDTGSSFLPSDILAAFLYAQLQQIDTIQAKRKLIYNTYMQLLNDLNKYQISLPQHLEYGQNNGHVFYLICNNFEQRTQLISELKKLEIYPVFHYISLHKSDYIQAEQPYTQSKLPNSDNFTDCLLRLPLYFNLTIEQVHFICESIIDICQKNNYSYTR